MKEPRTVPDELPQVTEGDVLDAGVHDLIDPKHKAIWHELSQRNPALARAILERAYFMAKGNPELQQQGVRMVTFTLLALHIASQREAGQSQSESPKTNRQATSTPKNHSV